ncbi:MAG: hypothetical protein BWK80_35535 [Desulfobacteraceae bacterium IS3]|nr:MAG: hypothetical protein BWK80_35535 [Desulfobacteraceae bacterium IS3]
MKACTMDEIRKEETMTCPKCGLKQQKSEECIRCGIIIKKFLDNAAKQKTEIGTQSEQPQQEAQVHRKTSSMTDSNIFRWAFNLFSKKGAMFHIGILIFSVGVIFMIHYGTVHIKMNSEMGFGAILIGALSLLGIGWFLIKYGRIYALILQGNAIALLFACLFAATERYGIFPPVVGFIAMLILCILSGLLAVLQNARIIAVIGIGGAFLAPLLCPAANAETLFLLGFYLVLTTGILWISWFRSWRELNILGFVFTVIVGYTWGRIEYSPEFFLYFEVFIIAFFLLYSGITVRYAFVHTRPADMLLILGVPLCFIFFQGAVGRHIPYMMAASCALLSVFYSVLTFLLNRRALPENRQMVLLYFALAMIFGNIALPLVFSPVLKSSENITDWFRKAFFSPEIHISATILLCSCEAFFLIFAGSRIRNSFLLGCGIAFHSISALLLARFSSFYQVDFLTGIAGFASFLSSALSSYLLKQNSEKRLVSAVLLLWSILVWLTTGYITMIMNLPVEFANTGVLLILAAAAWGMYALSHRLSWEMMGSMLNVLYGPALLIFALSGLIPDKYGSALPFAPSPFAWLVAVISWYHILYLREKHCASAVNPIVHRLALWIITFGLCLELHKIVKISAPAESVWAFSVVGACLGLICTLILFGGSKISWPFAAHPREYEENGIIPLLVCAWIWILSGCISDGNSHPVSYIPLINPLEISQFLCLIVIFRWKRRMMDVGKTFLPSYVIEKLPNALYGTALICITSVIARCVAGFVKIDFYNTRLFYSPVYQTILSVFMSFLSLIIMRWAVKNRNLLIWQKGSMLMFLVVIKLFLIDVFLSQEIGRAFAFMWVGILMIVSGSFMSEQSEHLQEKAV